MIKTFPVGLVRFSVDFFLSTDKGSQIAGADLTKKGTNHKTLKLTGKRHLKYSLPRKMARPEY